MPSAVPSTWAVRVTERKSVTPWSVRPGRLPVNTWEGVLPQTRPSLENCFKYLQASLVWKNTSNCDNLKEQSLLDFLHIHIIVKMISTKILYNSAFLFCLSSALLSFCYNIKSHLLGSCSPVSSLHPPISHTQCSVLL